MDFGKEEAKGMKADFWRNFRCRKPAKTQSLGHGGQLRKAKLCLIALPESAFQSGGVPSSPPRLPGGGALRGRGVRRRSAGTSR